MGLFNWGRKAAEPNPIYSVMNDDHVALYRIVAELRDAINTRVKGDTERGFQHSKLLDIVQKLIDKSREHFLREEELMQRFGYPDLRAHKSEHLMLLRSVETYHANLVSGARAITEEVVRYLKGWLTNHIRTSDRRLDRFLASAAKQTGRIGRADLGQGGESNWTLENGLMWANLQDAVSKETVNSNRQQNRDTVQEMLVRQQRERDRQQKAIGRRKAATEARQTRAIFFE